jgi:hypothetical protein
LFSVETARRRTANLAATIMLETAQEDLLVSMVDAARRVPREQQQWRLFNDVLTGPWGERQVLRSDVSALRTAGFLEAVSDNYLSGSVYVVTGVGGFTAEAIREERSPGFSGQEADARPIVGVLRFSPGLPECFRTMGRSGPGAALFFRRRTDDGWSQGA